MLSINTILNYHITCFNLIEIYMLTYTYLLIYMALIFLYKLYDLNYL